jgi:hypothetical protein
MSIASYWYSDARHVSFAYVKDVCEIRNKMVIVGAKEARRTEIADEELVVGQSLSRASSSPAMSIVEPRPNVVAAAGTFPAKSITTKADIRSAMISVQKRSK